MVAEFKAAKCSNCGDVVCEAMFRGLVRVVCRNKRCKRRVWVMSDGEQVVVWTADTAPRVLESARQLPPSS